MMAGCLPRASLLAVAAALAAAGEARAQGTTTSLAVGGYSCQAWIPAGAQPGGTAIPVLLALHGSGDRAENYLRVVRHYLGSRRWAVIAPQSPGPMWPVEMVPALPKMVDALAARSSADRSRVYLNGHSAGHAFALYALGELPDLFAAAALTAGYYPPGCNEEGLRRAKATPIWFAVGKRDPNHAHLAAGVAQLRALGLEVTPYEPDIGHTISADEARALFAWLDGKRRPGPGGADPPAKKTPEPPKKTSEPPKAEPSWMEREERAAARLAEADRHWAAGKVLEAHDAYRKVADEDKGTEASQAAARRLEELLRRLEVRRALEERRIRLEEEGARLLWLKGINQATNGETAAARAAFEEIVRRWPKSQWAAKARERLAE